MTVNRHYAELASLQTLARLTGTRIFRRQGNEGCVDPPLLGPNLGPLAPSVGFATLLIRARDSTVIAD